jgi:hypothetical protein
MEPFRDDQLIAELRGLRPAPRPAFAAELDARAAAGFPRKASLGGPPLSRLAARLRALPPRRLLLPAAGTALTAVVLATAVVAISNLGSGGSRVLVTKPQVIRVAGPKAGEAESLSSGASEEVIKSKGNAGLSAPALSSGSLTSKGRSFDGNASYDATQTVRPFAFQARHREVERAAQIVLGTTPSEVHEVADQVLQTVHTYRGIVLRSSIHDVGEADSTFELLIPSPKLSDALAGFSEAGEVLSRSESTADVTARTISLGERLQDVEASVKSLLGQLAAAESDSEREVVEAELHSARERAAGLRSRLSSLQRRVHFSRVSLRIDSKPGAATGGDTHHWDLSDALRNASRILATAAGVILVGLAVIAPLALIALIAWLLRRAWLRRAREQALG